MAEEERISIEQKYKAVFRQGFGREVLADILNDLHWGIRLQPNDPEEIGEYNAGVRIAQKSGLVAEIAQYIGIIQEEESDGQ